MPHLIPDDDRAHLKAKETLALADKLIEQARAMMVEGMGPAACNQCLSTLLFAAAVAHATAVGRTGNAAEALGVAGNMRRVDPLVTELLELLILRAGTAAMIADVGRPH